MGMPLTLTKRAAAIITIVVGQRPAAADGGLRITANAGGYTVVFVPERQPGDQVIEQAGARVFLDAAASVALVDKTLDGRVTDEGAPTFDIVG